MSKRVPTAGRRRFRSAASCAVLALSCAVLAGCAGGPPDSPSFSLAASMPIQGIDVSKYQGNVDWQAVADSGVRFAWIKATEGGDYLDEKFRQNWQMAGAAGVARGAYHFMYWCRPASQQAAWFVANVPNDPSALPPVLDVEWNPQSRSCPHKRPREEAIADMKTVLDGMERAYGRRPVIYTSVDFHRDIMQGEFEDYPIWVRSVKYHPSVKYGERRWHFWQHTATGTVPGITGFVDRNCYNGSTAEWQAWLGALQAQG